MMMMRPKQRKAPRTNLEPKRSRGWGLLIIVGAVVAFFATMTLIVGITQWSGEMLLKPLAGMLAPLVAVPIYLVAKRLMSVSAKSAQARDPRLPILYLRPFAFDGEKFEPLLEKALRRWGPMIALGKPGEALASLGASRDYVSHDSWEGEVEAALRKCQMVVLRVGEGKAFRWEVETTLGLLPLHKIAFFFPEGPFGYAHLKKTYVELLPVLPRFSGYGLFLIFDRDGKPQLLEPQQGSKVRFASATQILRNMLEPVFSKGEA